MLRHTESGGYCRLRFGEAADGQPTVSRPEAALLADMIARRLGITNKWKFFELLWHRNNMRGDYNAALEQRKSLAFQERVKNLLD